MLDNFLCLIISKMGVTLERVQNKFACIIGELCSEPVLLSQFAIWVDLRISEYKSKGTISLDCSGENPDPSWLKGHINPPPRRGIEAGELIRPRPGPASARNSLPHKSILGSRDPLRLTNVQTQRLQETARTEQNVDFDQDRLSPDVVLVKEEPTDSDAHGAGIFPVTLHRHDNSSPSGRKRTADSSEHDLLQSDGSFFSQNQSFQSPSKMRRIDSTSDDGATLDSQSNQSFMSIIGLPEQEYPEGGELSQSDMNLMVSGDEHKGGNSFSFRQTTAAATATLSSPSTSDAASRLNSSGNAVPNMPKCQKREKTNGAGNDDDVPDNQPARHSPNLPTIYGTRTINRLNIRSRILNVEKRSPAAVRNIVGTVLSLQEWLGEHSEFRRIESIPPDELDSYLKEFYPDLKKPGGDNYVPDSFRDFRKRLDNFLKENNYPCSIINSPAFSRSQRAYTAKRNFLIQMAVDRGSKNFKL